MKAARKYLTPKERAAMIEAQHHLCGCGCEQPLGARTVAEHWICVAMGNASKPDAILRYDCALTKTKRDVKAIAKVKRIRKRADGLRRPRKAIPKRDWDKTIRKRMDGRVERVTP